MKKLIAMIAAAVMGFAYGDGLKNTIGFEQLDPGVLDTTKTDDGQVTETDRYWYAGAEELGTVTAYGESDDKYAYTPAQPALVEDGPGDKFLALDSGSTVLYRTITKNSGTLPTATDIDEGLFFDSLVKFTVTEYDPNAAITVDEGTKLAVWLGQPESDDGDAETNLIVTAGIWDAIQEKYVASNFVATTTADVTDGAWHRVTARAIKSVTTDDSAAGFTLFIDGVAVEYATAPEALLAGSATPRTEANLLIGKNQLFLNVMSGKQDCTKLQGFGFKGTGSIDDVAITDKANAPKFALGQKQLSVSWDANVASITIAGQELDLAGTMPAVVMLDEMEVAATVTYKPGYIAGQNTGTATFDGETITLSDEVDSIGFVSAPIVCMIGTTPYATVEAALLDAAKAGVATTITLQSACAGWTTKQTIDAATANVTLDLNGETLTFADYKQSRVLAVSNGSLTVIDSKGNGKIVVNPTNPEDFGGFFQITAPGAVYIGLDEGDEGATFDANIGAATAIKKGFFLAEENGKETLEEFINKESYQVKAAADASYWEVCAAETPTQKFSGGTGTELDPYQISCVADLQELAADVTNSISYADMFFKQTADIDMDGVDWSPIGGKPASAHSLANNVFCGTYDGFGHSISNLSAVGQKYGAAFISNARNAVFLNLTIHVKEIIPAANGADYGAAAFVGCGDIVTFSNCVAQGTITANHNAGGFFCMGNWVDGPITFIDCVNEANVTRTKSGVAGGFAGNPQNGAAFIRCVNKGTVQASTAGAFSGASATFEDCVNEGQVLDASGNATRPQYYKVTDKFGSTNYKPEGTTVIYDVVPLAGVNKARADQIAVDGTSIGLTEGLWFGDVETTTDAGIITLVSTNDFVAGGEYLVTASAVPAVQVFELAAEGDTIAFDLSLVNDACTFTVGAAAGLKAEAAPVENHIVTFTAVKDGPTDWPTDPEDPLVKGKTAAEAFPDKVPTTLAGVPAANFAAWAIKAGIDFANPGEINVDAYLLDCAVADLETEKAKFKITKIEFVNGKWVVTVTGDKTDDQPYNDNAKVEIVDVTTTLDAEATDGATEAKGFFKAELKPITLTK